MYQVHLRVPQVTAAYGGLAIVNLMRVPALVSRLGWAGLYAWLSCQATFCCLLSFFRLMNFFHEPRVLRALKPGIAASPWSEAYGMVSYWSGVLAVQSLEMYGFYPDG